MADVAVRVEGLGKRYSLGQRFRYLTLREKLAGWARAPLGFIRRGQRRAEESRTLWALRDLSFEVREGEAVGIIGRNGAGKTTLLKLISRITAPTEGLIEIYGRVGS